MRCIAERQQEPACGCLCWNTRRECIDGALERLYQSFGYPLVAGGHFCRPSCGKAYLCFQLSMTLSVAALWHVLSPGFLLPVSHFTVSCTLCELRRTMQTRERHFVHCVCCGVCCWFNEIVYFIIFNYFLSAANDWPALVWFTAGHINNLYNTCFWLLVKKGMTGKEAEAKLCVSCGDYQQYSAY